ncbi:MAG TPA: SGNH/GDSL hydrolase family protein [Candidatus Limnocylindrales bacterium]|nr:SGNH/GDSL hydrolase family protein [Candidatus Limnocylindrales bacterium]
MTFKKGRAFLLVLFCWMASTVRGELILTNFSATNLMKIMPVGDSITDDCSVNGAWRLYLQPLLESNHIAFTNTGRNVSAAATGFTKRRHEGYCGSVIGPPGVFAVYSYSTTDAYLQRIIRDALAITNNRPDLMLILIGTNDIGRGRDPWKVATNDMPILLDLILSNVPNANVCIAKITTLQSAGLGYSAYATNVPIYNAALQMMVNQRRALGQNIFLADMYSVVDYATMFLSDHLHPNPLGLKAIANEWAARIETFLIRTNQTATLFIHGGADWKYFDQGRDLGTNWTRADFDDSAWYEGAARLGYGDPATATVLSYGPASTNKFPTTYFRRSFVVPWNLVVTNLTFRLACSGGARVWLNGSEIYRTNLPAGSISYTNLASSFRTALAAHIFYPTNIPVTGLAAGTNLVAVEVHQSSLTYPTLGFDLELIGSGYLLSAPSLSIAPIGTNMVLSWPVTNGSGFALLSASNLTSTANWTTSTASFQTNGDQIVVTQSPDTSARFFRLQRP